VAGTSSATSRPPLLLPKMMAIANSISLALELTFNSTSSAAASSDSTYVLADVQRPVQIVGFGRRAKIYDSKQKPKLVTIYGSDFR